MPHGDLSIPLDLKDIDNFPILRPVIIPTKGQPWYKKMGVWFFSKRKFEVVQDYLLYIPFLDATLLIPKGFIFDGASIPRLLWPLLSPTGILFIPALFHDFAYKYSCYLNERKEMVFVNKKKSVYDKIFRDMSRYINDMSFLSGAAWVALFSFGAIAWRNARKLNMSVLLMFVGVIDTTVDVVTTVAQSGTKSSFKDN